MDECIGKVMMNGSKEIRESFLSQHFIIIPYLNLFLVTQEIILMDMLTSLITDFSDSLLTF